MKFSALAIPVFAAAVASASPLAADVDSPVMSVTAVPAASVTATPLPAAPAFAMISAPQEPNVPGVLFCKTFISCIEELADVVSSCTAAAAGMGADIVQDVKCLVDAAHSITKIPKACDGCLSL